MILHVRDISHDDSEAQAQDVGEVLRQLDIDPQDGRRLIEVWNKLDLVEPERRLQLANRAERAPLERRPVLVSATTGEGIEQLQEAIELRVVAGRSTFMLTLDAADGEGASWLHRHTEVLAKSVEEDGRLAMTVRTDPSKAELVRRKFGRNIGRVMRGTEFGTVAGR